MCLYTLRLNTYVYVTSEVFKLIFISNLYYLSVQISVTLFYFQVLCQVEVLMYVQCTCHMICCHLGISIMCLLRIQPWMRPTEVYLLKLCVPLRRFSSGEIRMTAECLSKILLTHLYWFTLFLCTWLRYIVMVIALFIIMTIITIL